MRANQVAELNKFEGIKTRNFTGYNPQVVRDDVFQLGVDATYKQNRLAVLRSSSAVIVGSQKFLGDDPGELLRANLGLRDGISSACAPLCRKKSRCFAPQPGKFPKADRTKVNSLIPAILYGHGELNLQSAIVTVTFQREHGTFSRGALAGRV